MSINAFCQFLTTFNIRKNVFKKYLLQVCARLEIFMIRAGLALSNFGISMEVNKKCPK